MSSLSLVQIHDLVAKVPSSSFFGLPVPYVPVSNKDLLEDSKKATIKTDASIGPCPVKQVPKEVLEVTFSYITDLEDFKNVSEVCRVFYRVSKCEALWKNHFCSLLPDVCPLTSGTSFTIEAQFKIAFEAHKSAIKKLMEADKYSNVLRQRCSINLIIKGAYWSFCGKVYQLKERLNKINNQENFEKIIKHVEHYDKFANSLLYIRVSEKLDHLKRETIGNTNSYIASKFMHMSLFGKITATTVYLMACSALGFTIAVYQMEEHDRRAALRFLSL